MKTMILAVLAASLFSIGCSSVQARGPKGTSYTCVPNDARDRGPTIATPDKGERLTVK